MPEIDFDFLRSFFSIGASAAALTSSIYLWVTRFQREQPNLAIEQVSPLVGEFVWPVQFAELYQTIKPGDDEGLACLWADVAVINNSTMPNAILQIDAWIKLANGQWHPTLVSLREETTLPANVTPHSTARLALQLATKLPYDGTRTSNRDRVDQIDEQIAETRDFKIRVRGVKGASFQSTLTQPTNIVESKFAATEKRAA